MSSQLVLASASPRRKELLAQLGYDFTVIVSDVDENIELCEPSKYVEELSRRKALAVADALLTGGVKEDYDTTLVASGTTIIGADTVVAIDGKILGKPKDEDDAMRMLLLLGGRSHSVFTGVTIVKIKNPENVGDYSIDTFAEETKVFMYPISEREALEYIATGEPMDKAGAYAIQGIAGKFVEKIEGSYNNVVGLPVEKIYQKLK